MLSLLLGLAAADEHGEGHVEVQLGVPLDEGLPADVGQAAYTGQTTVVRTWLEGGGRVDARDTDESRKNSTLLHFAAAEGRMPVVRLLLAHGASVDVQNSQGATPLILASMNGHERVADELLGAGASTMLRANNGKAALHVAEDAGHDQLATLLRAQRAPIRISAEVSGGGLVVRPLQLSLLLVVVGSIALAVRLALRHAMPSHVPSSAAAYATNPGGRGKAKAGGGGKVPKRSKVQKSQ